MKIKDHLHVILFVLFFIEPESRKEVYLSMKLLQSNKIFNQKIAMKCLVIAWKFLQLNSKNIPANTSTLKQHWSSTFINVVSTLIFSWKWSWADVHLSTLFRRWQNNVETTSIELRRFNVDKTRCFNVETWLKMKVEPTHVYRCCFNVDETTLKQHWKNYVDSTSINQCCFNFCIWLKMKVEFVHRRCFNVEKRALKQLCQYLVYWSLESNSIKNPKFSSIKHIFLLHKSIIKLLFHL